MVLISMHPFALRRLFLIAVALAGFSALCFADPVLMTQRYRSDKVRAVTACTPIVSHEAPAAIPLPGLDSANPLSRLSTDTADVSLDKASAPEWLPGPVASWNRHHAWRSDILYGTSNNSLFLTPHTAN